MTSIDAAHASLLKGITPSSRPRPPKTSSNAGPPRTAEHISTVPKKTTQAGLNKAAKAKPKG